MTIILDDHQASLADLNREGSEQVKRFQNLLHSDALTNKIQSELKVILNERQSAMQSLGNLQRTRGVLPKEGDPDRALLHSLKDWAHDQMLNDVDTTIRRLQAADQAWLDSIDQALELDWNTSEQRILKSLRVHVTSSLDRFEQLCDK